MLSIKFNSSFVGVGYISLFIFWGTYQVDVSQLQMVIAGYIYNYEHVITQRLISEMERPIRS